MTEITAAIQEVKRKVSMQEWQARIVECQQSGMGVQAWCKARGISASTYYRPLEAPMSAISPSVTAAEEIRIEANGIAITLPCSTSPEQLTAVLRTLKSC